MFFFNYKMKTQNEQLFPKKLSSIYKKGKENSIIKLKTFPINFKIIPYNIELFERKLQRKFIFHSYEIYQNEKTNMYNYDYLESFCKNLYLNKRNQSFSKKTLSPLHLSLNKSSLKTLNNSTGKINVNNKKVKLKLKISNNNNINKNNRVSNISKERLNFLKTSFVNKAKKNQNFSFNRKRSYSNSKENKHLFRN